MTIAIERRSTLPAMAASLWRNRQLIFDLARRDVIGRYRGSVAGLAWSFFNPLLMLAAYTFVFGVVFNARWGERTIAHDKADFALLLFIGLILHGLAAECLTRAPALILGNVNYVKRIVFPLEILPPVTLCAALFHALVSVVVFLCAALLLWGRLPATAVVLPVVILPYVIGLLGVCWILSALGVYLRDVGQTMGVLVAMLMFLSPVFYPLAAVPEEFRAMLFINPLTYFIESARDVLVWGNWPAPWPLLGSYVIAVAIAGVGFWWFQRTRNGFADVL